MNNVHPLSTRVLAFTLVFIQFSTLTAITFLDIIDFSTSYWMVNLGLISLASYLLVTAYKALKPSVRVNPIPREGAEFIQEGIYRRLRHPMYAAVLLYGYGAAGFSNNKVAIVLCGVLTVGIVVKAKFEDNLLLKAHPEIWKYQMATPGFIPCRCENSIKERF